MWYRDIEVRESKQSFEFLDLLFDCLRWRVELVRLTCWWLIDLHHWGYCSLNLNILNFSTSQFPVDLYLWVCCCWWIIFLNLWCLSKSSGWIRRWGYFPIGWVFWCLENTWAFQHLHLWVSIWVDRFLRCDEWQ